jgi:pimeloyl-ACP methyl ester carboxylesterase
MPAASATQDLYLPLAGARLRYRDQGRGPAVLLIHGWTLDLDMWEPQVAQLRDSFRLVRFDRRGFGLSSGNASLAADVADALELCDALRLERLACLGMSQGARVALRLCQRSPERLSCLILDGPPRALAPAAHREGEDVPVREYRRLIARGDIDSFRRRWASHPLMRLETRSAEARALLERMAARYRGGDLLSEAAQPSVQSASEELAERDLESSPGIPTLIVTGEHELPARVRAADALAQHLPLAERASIAAARHLPNLDNPSSYNAVLRAFLERHAGSRP